jgi:hypothetical protein
LYRAWSDRAALARSNNFSQAQGTVKALADLQNQYSRLQGQGPEEAQQTSQLKGLFGYRSFWPSMLQMVAQTVAMTAQDQPLLDLYTSARTEQERQAVLAQIKAKPRAQREMIFVESIEPTYEKDVSAVTLTDVISGSRTRTTAGPARKPGVAPEEVVVKRGYVIKLTARTPLDPQMAVLMLVRMKDNAQKAAAEDPMVKVVDVQFGQPSRKGARAGGLGMGGFDMSQMMAEAEEDEGGTSGSLYRKGKDQAKGPVNPDPLILDEDKSNDSYFTIAWLVSIEGDGVTPASEAGASATPAAATEEE